MCSTWPSGGTFEVDTVVDAGLYRRGRFITTVARWLSLGFGRASRRAGGTGVGLYLVREIVRLHEGTVEVRSRPRGGSLPAAAPG